MNPERQEGERRLEKEGVRIRPAPICTAPRAFPGDGLPQPVRPQRLRRFAAFRQTGIWQAADSARTLWVGYAKHTRGFKKKRIPPIPRQEQGKYSKKSPENLSLYFEQCIRAAKKAAKAAKEGDPFSRCKGKARWPAACGSLNESTGRPPQPREENSTQESPGKSAKCGFNRVILSLVISKSSLCGCY